MTGIFTVWQASHTIRRAMGLIAGPERPPVINRSLGRLFAISIAIPTKVFTAEIASAPASSHARANSRISVTLGESLTHRGRRRDAFLTSEVTVKVSRGSLLK